MAREIDLSKPLSDEDVKYLRARYSNQYVNHVVARANGSEFVEPEEETPEEMQAGDDPADFTVDEVIEFMSKPDTTDEERERILEAEGEGKARTGILGDA
jgi:hypothetical protein